MTKKKRISVSGILLLLALSIFAPIASGQIFVSDTFGHNIRQFDGNGNGSVFASGFQNPAGLAFDGAGNLYVADNSANTITKFALPSASPIPFATGLSGPVGLAWDSDILYVANFNNSTIRRYSTLNGADLGNFATTGLTQPFGLAISGGFLYVANSSVHTITKFDLTDGSTPILFAGIAGTTTHGLNVPWGLAASPGTPGYLYAGNNGDSTITKFLLPGGGGSPIQFANSGLSIPEGLAFDAAGSLYAVNGGNDTIEKFTQGTGSLFAEAGDGLLNPAFIAVFNTVTAPEIEVTGLGNVILSGDITPDPADGTYFGNVPWGGTPSSPHTFIIHNLGDSPLNVTGINLNGSNPADFTVSGFTPGTIAAGDTMSFEVTFHPVSFPGVLTAWVTVVNDDSDEGHYLFSVQGYATTPPEISVSGLSVYIINNETAPTGNDDTAFADTGGCDALSRTHTLTIWNHGTEPLNLTGTPVVAVSGANASDFTVTQPTSTAILGGGGWETFDVTFTPSGLGTRTATLSIASDDDTANPFNFAVEGTGIAGPAQIALSCVPDKSVLCGSDWSFDPPTGGNALNPATPALTVLSTVTNGVCPLAVTRTWQATDTCGNTATCSQTVTVTNAPPVFGCANPAVTVFSAGTTNDDFAGPEPAFPSAGLVQRLVAAGVGSLKNFDDCVINTFFAHSFTNLPSCITGATLRVRLKGCGSNYDNDDTLGLSFTASDGTLLPSGWSRYLGYNNGVGAPGLLSSWANGTLADITLDLSQLPNADGSATNLIPALNAQGFLDIIQQDDSSIDFLVLTVTSCCGSNDKTVEAGTAWTFDPPAVLASCSGESAALTVLSTVTNGVCPQLITRTWLATDACGGTNTHSQTVTVVDTTPPVLVCAADKSVLCGSDWSFDPPTGGNALNPATPALTVLSTVTNGVCPLAVTRTWQATDTCGNTATCSQTVTVTNAPPVFGCANPAVTVFSAGTTNDDFAGPEPAFPSAGLVQRLVAAGVGSLKNFDDCVINTFFAHSFTNLPSCITGATLRVRLKGCGSNYDNDDTLGLSFTASDGTLLPSGWSRYLGYNNGVAAPGLLSSWANGTLADITLDLSQLPNADGSATNLIPALNAQGFLDIIQQDDSSIDFLVLTVTSCCGSNDKTVEAGTAWTFDPPAVLASCSGESAALTVLSTVTNGVCPQLITRTWLATDACGGTNTHSQTVTVTGHAGPPKGQWAVAVGGADFQIGNAIAVDASGNSYIAGDFANSATFRSTLLNSAGGKDAFLAKYDTLGTFLWAAKMGGSHNDEALGVAVDSHGNSFVTGTFNETATFFSAGDTTGVTLIGSGNNDIFLAKYDPSGTLIWVAQAGGHEADSGAGVAVDGLGNAYITGTFTASATFSSAAPSLIAMPVTGNGSQDCFLAKYNASGEVQWVDSSSGEAGSYMAVSRGVAVSASGNDTWIVGEFSGKARFGTAADLAASENDEAFIARHGATSLTGWTWARQTSCGKFCGNRDGRAIGVDALGNSYFTAYYSGDAMLGTLGPVSASNGLTLYDCLIGSFAPDGTSRWLINGLAPSKTDQEPRGLAVNAAGDVYVTGLLNGTGGLYAAAGQSVWLTEYNSEGSTVWQERGVGHAGQENTGWAVALDPAGCVYLTGGFDDLSLSFTGFSPSSPLTDPSGLGEIFIVKYCRVCVDSTTVTNLTYGGLDYKSLGRAALNVVNNQLLLSGLGDSGEDGVSIALGQRHGWDGVWMPIDEASLADGAYLQTTLRGTVGGTADAVIASLRLTKAANIDEFELETDYSNLGATTLRYDFFLNGKPAGNTNLPTGQPLIVSGVPTDNHFNGYFANYTWQNRLPGSLAMVGKIPVDEVHVSPANPVTVSLDGDWTVTIQTAGISSLTFIDIPAIAIQPLSQTVQPGTPVTFSVAATGTSPLTYLWRFNGTPIEGATSASYTIPHVQENNVGTYDVVISNESNSLDSAMALLMLKTNFSIGQNPDRSLTVSWPMDEGWTLQEAATINGPWSNSESQTTPTKISPTDANKFYRLFKP